jgi:hypothetical protein
MRTLAALLLLAPLTAADGDVTATVTPGGDLVVLGDDANNRIRFSRDGGPLELSHSNGTINGVAGDFVVPAFTGRLLVDLGAGDDSFVIMQTHVADHVEVRLGIGDDHLDIESNGDELRLDLGDGDDQINLESASFDRTLVVGGDGDDRISLSFFDAHTTAIRCGAGNDEVIVNSCDLYGPVSLNGGTGVDTLDVEDPGFVGTPKILGFESRML